MKKLSILLLVALLSFSFVACGDDDDVLGSVSWTDDASSTLRIKNTSTVNALVVFKGNPTQAGYEILGGVPAGAQSHGVKRVDGLYVIYVVTKSQYESNINDLSKVKVAFSTLVYVDDRSATYTVSSGSTGDGVIRFRNFTQAYVEIRSSSKFGDPIITLRPDEEILQFMPVEPQGYLFYPVMKIEQRAGKAVVGIYDKYLTKLVTYFDTGTVDNPTRFEVSDSASAVEDTVAYVKLVNSTEVNGIVYKGDVEQRNQANRAVLMNGGESYYNFAATADITGLNLRGAQEGQRWNLPALSLTNGYRFTVIIGATNTTVTAVGPAPTTVTSANSTW